MTVSVNDEPTFYCLECLDETSAWRPFWCLGSGAFRTFNRPEHARGAMVDCGRQKPHRPHAYVHRCECYATNAVSAAAREREVKYRAKKAEKGLAS